MSTSSRARSVMTSFIGRPVYEGGTAARAPATRGVPPGHRRETRRGRRRRPRRARTPRPHTRRRPGHPAARSSTVPRRAPRAGRTRRRRYGACEARLAGACRSAISPSASACSWASSPRTNESKNSPRRCSRAASSSRSWCKVGSYPSFRSQPPRAFRSSCDTVRNEKCSTSIGCQARTGSSPGPRALWLPASIFTSRVARCATFWCAWKIVVLSPGKAGRARRTIIRSAKNEPSSGRGRKWRQQPRMTP